MTRTQLVAALIFASLLPATGCAARPPSKIAVGQTVEHGEAGFSVVVPADWQVRQSRHGISLVRETPYGGGFPTLNVRRVNTVELEALAIEGTRLTRDSGEVVYRYQAWNNSRGRGYRLEVLLRSNQDTLLFADASLWDGAASMNRAVFEDEFWPILNSIIDKP